MDLCHLKNAECENQFPKYRGRVVLRGDSDHRARIFRVTHDSRPSSRCHFLDFPDAQHKQLMQYRLTPKKSGRRAKVIGITRSRMFNDLDPSAKNPPPKSWDNIQDPVVLLERNLFGHPLAGLLWRTTN